MRHDQEREALWWSCIFLLIGLQFLQFSLWREVSACCNRAGKPAMEAWLSR